MTEYASSNAAGMAGRVFFRLRGRTALQAAVLLGLTLAVYLVFAPVEAAAPAGTIEILMALALAGCMGVATADSLRGRLDARKLLVLIAAAGLVMRLGYMLYTHYDVRCHDLPGPYSHTDYMYILASTGALPQNNGGEFYHPPLMYLLGAGVLKIAGLFNGAAAAQFNAVRVIPGAASCLTLLISLRLYEDLGLSARAMLLAAAVTAFHPVFIYLSSSVNNDMLSAFFVVLIVWLAVRWYRSRTMRRVLALAAAFGLGLMTKISVGVLAVPVGALMLYAAVKNLRDIRPRAAGGRGGSRRRVARRYLGQFAAFFGVCAPLGLWYPVRNLVRFGQSFGYICPTALTPLRPADLLLRFPVQRLFENPFNDFQNALDHNTYVFLLKTAMFTELSYPSLRLPALLLAAVNLVVVALSLAAMVYLALRRGGALNFGAKFLGLCWVTQMAAYVWFVAAHPVFCSSDFRYLPLTVVTGAAFLGMASDTLSARAPRLGRFLFRGTAAAAGAFGLLSCVYYVML